MRKYAVLLTFLMSFLLPTLGWTQANVPAPPAGKTLKVKLNYTGAGLVDEKHKVFVTLFDSDPFTATTLMEAGSPSATPAGPTATPWQAFKVCYILARQGAARKDQTLTFNGFRVSQVYASAFYDKGGAYDGHDFAPKSPMGIYGTKPGQPDPIKLQEGKAAEILLAFDDSLATP